MKKYWHVWLKLVHISLAEQLATRFSSILFLVGKISRFLLFFVFLINLLEKTNGLAGYSKEQMLLFFLIFNVIDITVQFLFRGVYFFREKVVTGEFDFYLLKPMHPLFRVLTGYADMLDLVTLIALVAYLGWFLGSGTIEITAMNLLVLVFMLAASLILAFAFHVVVVAIAVITTEVDHTIMIYRDLTQMARLPVDIYVEPVRIILTYLLPIALMITFPAKALMGLLSPTELLVALFIVFCSLFLALRFWRYALTQYGSASS